MKKFLLLVAMLCAVLTMPMRADVYTDGLKQLISLGTSSLDVEGLKSAFAASGQELDDATFENVMNGLVEIIAPYYRKALDEEQFGDYIRFYSQPDIVELNKKNALATSIMKETNRTTMMTAMMRFSTGGQPVDVAPIPCTSTYEAAFQRYWDMNNMDSVLNSTFDMLALALGAENPQKKALIDQLIPYVKRNYKTANRNALLTVMTEQELQRYTSVVDMPFYEPSRQVASNMAADLPNFLEKIVTLMSSEEGTVGPKEELPMVEEAPAPQSWERPDDWAETNEVFAVTEVMPQFPGGYAKGMQYISDNTHYPRTALKVRAEGRAICQFVVEKDGSFSDISVVRTSGNADLDAEAVRVISSMPRWTPGRQRGKAVRVRYTLPITFKLPEQ